MKERIRVCVYKLTETLCLCYWNKSNEKFSDENQITTPDFLVFFPCEKYFEAKKKGALIASTTFDTKFNLFIGSHKEEVDVLPVDDYDIEAFLWSLTRINKMDKRISYVVKNGDIHTIFSDRSFHKANVVYF